MGQSGTVAGSGCVIRRRMESRSLATSPRRNWGNSTRRGLLRGAVVRAHAEKGVNRPLPKNGWHVPRAPVSGFATVWGHRAPLWGLFARRRSFEHGAWAGAHSTGRSNTQMEPSRLTVCAIMALRRAAHLQR